jgi:hypothetical protein
MAQHQHRRPYTVGAGNTRGSSSSPGSPFLASHHPRRLTCQGDSYHSLTTSCRCPARHLSSGDRARPSLFRDQRLHGRIDADPCPVATDLHRPQRRMHIERAAHRQRPGPRSYRRTSATRGTCHPLSQSPSDHGAPDMHLCRGARLRATISVVSVRADLTPGRVVGGSADWVRSHLIRSAGGRNRAQRGMPRSSVRSTSTVTSSASAADPTA